MQDTARHFNFCDIYKHIKFWCQSSHQFIKIDEVTINGSSPVYPSKGAITLICFQTCICQKSVSRDSNAHKKGCILSKQTCFVQDKYRGKKISRLLFWLMDSYVRISQSQNRFCFCNIWTEIMTVVVLRFLALPLWIWFNHSYTVLMRQSCSVLKLLISSGCRCLFSVDSCLFMSRRNAKDLRLSLTY